MAGEQRSVDIKQRPPADGSSKSGDGKAPRRGKQIPKSARVETKSTTADPNVGDPLATMATVGASLPSYVGDVRAGADTAKPVKSKSELKAERRAQQEAQRAKKAAKTVSEPTTEKAPSAVRKDSLRVRDSVTADVASTQQKKAKELAKDKLPAQPSTPRQVRLFSHLHQHEKNVHLTASIPLSGSPIHPAIVTLGLQYAGGVYCGSNARCLALLAAFKKVIGDYTTPHHKELSRDLDAKIKPNIRFLTRCRPMSVSMGNAIKSIKWHINNMPSDIPEFEAKRRLIESIDNFWRERIVLAGQAIAHLVGKKITDGDVIVVYSCSSVVVRALLQAKEKKKKFRVIVVDARPKMEGREILRRLVNAGIECSYVLITTASYVMKEATKVLLGAHALLANGCVMSRIGSSMLALVAKSFNVPVLVCCETYKFCERVQTDSFVFNELGDPDDLVTVGDHGFAPYLGDWRDQESLLKLNLLNLVYDVTPAEFVSMVITELGMIPCTSVPVVLRVGQAKIA